MGKKSRNKKKRAAAAARAKNAEESGSEHGGVAATLAQIHGDGDLSPYDGTNEGERPHKRQKSENSGSESKDGASGSRKPTLTYAEAHKISTMIKIQDLQNLVLYVLADGLGPQWISVNRHNQVQKAVVVLVPGLERAMFTGKLPLPEKKVEEPEDQERIADHANMETEDFIPVPQSHSTYMIAKDPDDYLPMMLNKDSLPASLSALADIFHHVWPVKTPGDDKTAKLWSPLHAMLNSHIPKSKAEKELDKKKGGVKPAQQMNSWVNERTPINHFIATAEDLLENDYVLHPALCSTEAEKAENVKRREVGKFTEADGWVDTLVKDKEEGTVPSEDIENGSITAGRTIYAIDCEMCLAEGDEFVLTRISVVDWDGKVIIDEYVKPDKPIKDYLTPYSGVTPELLADVTTSLSDIQGRLLELFHARTIIVGHSLESDLRALKIAHPFILDTSILYPHPRGPPLKSSLKWLAEKYLRKEIQKGHGTKGHDSVEDARSTLDLVKQKCERGPKWGASDANHESIFKRLLRAPKKGAISSLSGEQPGKTGVIVDHGSPAHGSMATHFIGCSNDAEVVEGVKRAVLGDPDGAVIPGGGVDFTWARLRELETIRGWKNENRNQPVFASQPQTAPPPEELSNAVASTVEHITAIRNLLPPCTLLVVYSGTGDPLDMARMQEMHRTFRREYRTKKWDELSVKWTDTEEQSLRRATAIARNGLGFVCLT